MLTIHRLTVSLFVGYELDTDRLSEFDVFLRVGKQAGGCIATEDLDDVTVLTSYNHIFPIGCDIEVTWMNSGKLISYPFEHSLAVYLKGNDSISFQTISGIEELPVRTDMDVCTTVCTYRVGDDSLYLFHGSISRIICIGDHCAAEFCWTTYARSTFGREGHVTRSRPWACLIGGRSAGL